MKNCVEKLINDFDFSFDFGNPVGFWDDRDEYVADLLNIPDTIMVRDTIYDSFEFLRDIIKDIKELVKIRYDIENTFEYI